MLENLYASSIMQLHGAMLGEATMPTVAGDDVAKGIWFWIQENHRYNNSLWNEEDKARRTDVDDAEIAACKRLIDSYNQKRNDAVESIDEALLSALQTYPRHPDARLNSETAGSMIDRLSILSLKVYHMREQTLRDDATPQHVAKCQAKLQHLTEQRGDLGACLDRLLEETKEGRSYFKVYRQFKMYNDPTLNPYLYGAHKAVQESVAPSQRTH